MSVQWNPIAKPLQYSSKNKNWHLQYFGKNMVQMPAVCHHHSKDVVIHLPHNFMCFDFDVFWWFSRSKSMLQRQNISLTITGIEVIVMIFCFSCVWTSNDCFQKPLRCSKIHSFYLWHTYMLLWLVCVWLRSFPFSNLNLLLNYQTYLGDLDWLCLVVFDRLHFLPSFPMSLGKEPFFPRWPPFLPLDCLTG